MALPATYEHIGLYAAAQIALLNSASSVGAQQMAGYLGARAAIVQNHFPAGWLNRIRVRVLPVIPAPNLTRLWQDMGYVNLAGFQTACHGTSQYLLSALHLFSHPLTPQIVAITYDDVVYLRPAHQHDLSIIVHELVHTLQWNRFGPAGFLTRYIRGFVSSGLNYPMNPAEVRAYHYQNQFRAAAQHNGVNLVPVIYRQLAVNPDGELNAQLINTLNGLPGLGINEVGAITGM